MASEDRNKILQDELDNFAKHLRVQRISLGLRQVELAPRIGISNTQLSNIEKGNNWPSLPVYFRLCRALKTSAPPLTK